MEKLHDVVHHPHEFTICGGRVHALCCEVTNGHCGVMQTEWERCRSALGEVFRGEQLPSGKLCHNIGGREGEAAQVLLR